MDKQQLVITLKSLFEDEGFNALSDSLQDLNKKVEDFEKKSGKLEKTNLALKDIGDSAKKMQLTVTAPIIAAGTAAVMGAAKIESFTASFTTMLGNEEKAEKLIGQLNRMAAVTPFDPEPLIKSSKTLLAYQIQVEDIESTLKMLGDASGGSAEALESLSMAYGKIATKGRASMEELNIMIDRGVPILNALSESLGVSTEKIIEMTSQGKIRFEDVNAAFEKMTSEGGVFFNGMQTASETLNGKISTLTGGIEQFAAMMAEELVPIAKEAVDGLIAVTDGFMAMDESTKSAILATAGVAAALPPVITAVTAMTAKIKALTAAMKAGNVAALANPYTAIGVAIAAIVAGLTMWIIKQNDLNAKVKDLQKQSEKTADAIQKVVQARNAEEEATRNGTATQREREEVVEAEIDFQKKLEEQLKKTADATSKNRRELQEQAELQEKFERQKNILELSKEKGQRTAKDPNSTVRRISIDDAIKKYEELIRAAEGKTEELREKISTVTKEIVEDVALAMRENIDVEKVLLETNDLTKQDGREILELAKAYNEELKKRQELEQKEQQASPSATSNAEKDEKDRFDRLAEIYRKYVENKEKIESDLLTNSEKRALQAENQKNEALYKEYEAYLQRKETVTEESEKRISESQSLSAFERYLDDKENALYGYYEDYQEYLDLQLSADREYLENNLAEYIQFLNDKIAAGKELSAAEQSAVNRFNNLEGFADVKNAYDELIERTNILGGLFAAASNSIMTNFQTANIAATGLGEVMAPLADFGMVLSDNFANFAINMQNATTEAEKTAAKAELIGQSIAAGLQAAGEAVNAVFSAISANIEAELEAMNATVEGQLERELKEIEELYNAQIKAEENAKNEKLKILQDEYAARGVIIDTGNESELEKAQRAYNEALKALAEYEDETTSARQTQLDNYKEQLQARNDEDIQNALEAKQREIDSVNDKKKAELQKNVDTKKAEVERQKILEESEKKISETEKELDFQRRQAEYNAEVERLTREHELTVEQFNLKKAQDIANIWIAQAAGIATIWATAMQLGPIAGPIAAGVLTGTLATVAGVQTGLIASQAPPAAPTMPEPPAKYMTGGVIPGNDNQDRTLILASSGERVLTQKQNELFEKMVNNLDNAGNSPVINVHVYVDGDEIGIERKIIEMQKESRWSGKWGM